MDRLGKKLASEDFAKRARRVLSTALEDRLRYSKTKVIKTDPRLFSTYIRVKSYCAECLGLESEHIESQQDFDEIAPKIAKLLECQRSLLESGANALSIELGLDFSFVFYNFPAANLMQKSFSSKQNQGITYQDTDKFFFLLALDSISQFVDYANDSSRTEKQRKKSSEREASSNSMIIAASHLSHAQSALEYGIRHLEKRLKRAELEAIMEEAEKRFQQGIKDRASQMGAQGKAASDKRFDGGREFTKCRVDKELMASSDTINVTALAEEILEEMSKTDFSGEGSQKLPTINTVKRWVRAQIPEDRRAGRGRPKKK